MNKNIPNEKLRLANANNLYKLGRFIEAIDAYRLALSYHPQLEKIILKNIILAERKIKVASHPVEKKIPKELSVTNLCSEYEFDAIKKSRLFDIDFYLKNYSKKYGDIQNPLEHYLRYGISDKLNPSDQFDTSWYINSNPDVRDAGINPFIHYVIQGINEVGRHPLPPPVPDYSSKYTVALPEYVPRLPASDMGIEKIVRIIAFYLPQFHAIPENDAWWGVGFTEWSNVKPAKPLFQDHYQPHIPDDFIGYYNLLDGKTQAKQVELAKQYGIEGFCFYLYWFGGRKLLEQPLDAYLNDKSLDLPFCVCWANENWSRRWDGLDDDLLMTQNYSPEDDIAFISNAAKYFRDPRYIRVNDKPLLLVYRPALFPNPKETVYRWREWCRNNEIGEIYLTYPQSFESVDPGEFGFDAACEFPPNNSSPPRITSKLTPAGEALDANIYDWRIFLDRSEVYTNVGYKLFRGVCPSWDNVARKKNKGTVFYNSCPTLFKGWLKNAIFDTVENEPNPSEQIVFINAWNEWAEGAHLEPDRRYGYAWLDAVRTAQKEALEKRRRIVIVSHDAHPHGAQLLCLNFARYFKEYFNFDVELICLGQGNLIEQYAKYAQVHEIDLSYWKENEISALLNRIRTRGAEVALVNSTVSGKLIPYLKSAGFSIVSLVHELPGILNSYSLLEHAQCIASSADKVVFPAEAVKIGFENFIGSELTQAVIRPQGLYQDSPLSSGVNKNGVREAIRKSLGLPLESKIIMCAGYADHRKGFDLFIEACLKVMDKMPNAFGLWVGHLDQKFVDKALTKADAVGLRQNFIFTGLIQKPGDYYLAADIYALTSREDPFPSVVMEALDALTPVVAFKDCGGYEKLLERDCGVLVKKGDTQAYADAILKLLHQEKEMGRLAANGRKIIRSEFNFNHYLFDLLEFANKPLHKISVVVPNYCYEQYIEQRLDAIINQTYPIYELIILDDCSPDNSVEVIKNYIKGCKIALRFECNLINSGSVFRQWYKGANLAQGDLIWIAEADDLSESSFLEELVDFFEQSEVVLAYAQSKQIDEDGNFLADNYLYYTNNIGDYWESSYIVDGVEEVQRSLCVKNTILNVSAVIFRRNNLIDVLSNNIEKIASLKVAGDWLCYLYLAKLGKFAFNASSLNIHRRHLNSITLKSNHLNEVHYIHDLIKMQFAIASKMKPMMDLELSLLTSNH